ncbi:hypothetical protein LCGC14_2449180, partial [marine sediment metagenome]
MTRLKIWLALLSVNLLLPSTAWPEVWAASGFEDSPADSDQASAGAGKIRDTRGEARKRLEVEHFFGDTAASEDDDNGLHRIGAARCYMQDAAPTGLFDSHSGIGLITDLTDYEGLLYVPKEKQPWFLTSGGTATSFGREIEPLESTTTGKNSRGYKGIFYIPAGTSALYAYDIGAGTITTINPKDYAPDIPNYSGQV